MSGNENNRNEVWISPAEALRRGIITTEPVRLATPCLICGEDVYVGHVQYAPKICEHCKLAVMEIRKQLNASCGNCAIKEHDNINGYW